MDYLFLLIGFVVLIVGAHYLVNGASGLAKRFNVSDLVIGLTVVAFGTSAPEMVINLIAVLDTNTTDIALTNIIGSNMINTFVILGVAALIFPIASKLSSRRFDIPFSLFAPIAVLLLLYIFDFRINAIGGAILLAFFVWFMFIVVRKAIKHPEKVIDEEIKPIRVRLAIIMILGGLIGLVGGAQLIVPSATRIAVSWGVSQAVIGLTIVAFGTSLPELATSAVAAFKKNSDIALGNVLGSNIFNIFFVLSISSLIRPLPAYDAIVRDLVVVAFGSMLLLLFVYTSKSHSISRWAGALLLLIYFAYLVWIIAPAGF